MKAVVMAGGEGTRLRPLTSQRPKPLAPVLNKPIMEHIVGLLKRHGITDIVVTLHYLADEIEGYFGDGSEWGVKLTYSVEDTPLGTAGSVKLAEEHLRGDRFVIVSGDALTDFNVTAALEYHERQKSAATLVLSHVPNPLEFGVVITDDDGRVRRFLEKPSWGEVFSDTVNTGMYILEPDVFDYMEPGRSYDWSQDIFPRMLEEGKPLFGYVMPDYWCDVGNLNQYREAQYTVLEGRTNIEMAGEFADGIWVGEGCDIEGEAELIPPALLGRNVRVKAGAKVGPYSVVGDNCIIEAGAAIHRSVLWDNVYVGTNSRLSACTTCSHVMIQRDCNVQEGAVIGERCKIERDSTVRTQIKLWPDKVIEAGSTVTMSLIWGQKWLGALFREEGVIGIANIEITPDFATKLGACYGAYLKRGSTVVTGRDSGLAARMIKRAVISGLMSVGCNVLDLRSTALPIMRHTLRGSDAAGGMYVRTAPNNPRLLLIEFLDREGVYLSKAAERKLETIFFREDFARADADMIGSLEFASRSLELYQESFSRRLSAQAIGSWKPKVVADLAFGRLSTMMPSILGPLGCDVIALNAYVDPTRAPRTPSERRELLPDLVSIVRTLKADVGVALTTDGEYMTLVDEHGDIVEGEKLLRVMACLTARTHPNARIAVPVTAPQQLEELVAPYGATVLRTKTDARSLMGLAACPATGGTPIDFAGNMTGGFIFSRFMPAYDSMFAFAKLLEMLGTANVSLAEVADGLPPAYIVHETVKCPWEHKGRVMREMARDAGSSDSAEGLDGVRFVGEGWWALVVPDASDPVFHVYAEGASADEAEEIARRHLEKVEVARG